MFTCMLFFSCMGALPLTPIYGTPFWWKIVTDVVRDVKPGPHFRAPRARCNQNETSEPANTVAPDHNTHTNTYSAAVARCQNRSVYVILTYMWFKIMWCQLFHSHSYDVFILANLTKINQLIYVETNKLSINDYIWCKSLNTDSLNVETWLINGAALKSKTKTIFLCVFQTTFLLITWIYANSFYIAENYSPRTV